MTDTKTVLKKADLTAAKAGSWYTIIGAGGDLQEWVKGYEDLLKEEGIGKPVAWYKTTGGEVNAFAGGDVESCDQFKKSLVFLFFPLDGLHVGKLALFKLRMQDRWFDDIIDNMRAFS